MKAVIPTAGEGTRLYPHTYTKPKPMVRIAGRPILGHILANFAETRVDEVVVVVGGPMQRQVIEYVRAEFGDRFECSFPEQTSPEGLGHSIYQARHDCEDEPVAIALGDMLFQNSYREYIEAHDDTPGVDGSIGIKAVDEPRHYGVVEVTDNRITGLVEKPEDPPSNLAISGIYVVEETAALFDALAYLIENDVRGAGDEYQLTDALSVMVERGSEFGTFPVGDWFDCGRPDTLLEANRIALDRMAANGADPDTVEDTVIVDPVDIGDGVHVEKSVVGPYVSVDDGARITESIVRDSIVGRESDLSRINLDGSIVGSKTVVTGDSTALNIGDNSSLEL